MRSAVVILGFFAAVWGAVGVVLAPMSPVWIGVPALISALLVLPGLRVAARLPARSAQEEARIGRLVGVWSAVEGVAILVSVNVVINLGHPELVTAVFALVVGLHFVPLARGIPVPTYWGTAAGMVALALAGIAAPARVPPFAIALGSALVLWASLAALIAGTRRRLAHPAP
jgi:hypothetical protein